MATGPAQAGPRGGQMKRSNTFFRNRSTNKRIKLLPMLKSFYVYFVRSLPTPEDTRPRGKYHCTADLLFNLFGFDQTSEADANSI